MTILDGQQCSDQSVRRSHAVLDEIMMPDADSEQEHEVITSSEIQEIQEYSGGHCTGELDFFIND